MAPKKKAKTAAPPLACFAGAKITVIGANPFQRKLWEAKIGAGAAFLKPSQAASLKEGNDFVVIAAENVDPATVRAKAGAAQLVGDRWLTDSIARNERQNAAAHAWGAVEERPEEAAPARRSDVLPKFGCQRKITKADDQNKQLTGWLKQQLEWWQNGCIEGDASQHTAVGLTYKVIALIRSWPTKITPENWEDQRMLLAKQHFMSGRSSSANGGWLAYLEQLVTGGLPALQRVDAFTFWEKDPVRVAVKEITEMHMGITKKQMEALARKMHMGIICADGGKQMEASSAASRRSGHPRWRRAIQHACVKTHRLVDRSRALPISDVLRRKLELAPCGSDAYPNSHIPMDVQETKQIHGILESAARFIGLHMTVVGSWRRGKVGGHDVDVIIHAPLDGPLIDARAYAFESPTGLGNELMARFFKAVDQFGPPGFLHPHRSAGGEIFGNAGGRLPKLNTKHACLSPNQRR